MMQAQKEATWPRYWRLSPEQATALEEITRRHHITLKQAVSIALTGNDSNKQIVFNMGAPFRDHVRTVLVAPESVLTALESEAKQRGKGAHPSDIFRERIKDYVDKNQVPVPEQTLPEGIHAR